jgi:hypothetical protein
MEDGSSSQSDRHPSSFDTIMLGILHGYRGQPPAVLDVVNGRAIDKEGGNAANLNILVHMGWEMSPGSREVASHELVKSGHTKLVMASLPSIHISGTS